MYKGRRNTGDNFIARCDHRYAVQVTKNFLKLVNNHIILCKQPFNMKLAVVQRFIKHSLHEPL